MNIILFSTADWDNPFWTNKQHMAKTFEKFNHKVIYIDSLGIRKPQASQKDLLRMLKKIKSLFKPYRRVSEKIWVVSPLVIPFYKYKCIRIFNNILLSTVIKVLMKFLNFKKYIIWTYSPVTDEIIDKFNAKHNIYHCVDDLSALPNVDKEIIKQKERELIKKSDYIFTTSQNLYEYIRLQNKNTFYQNNVCDYEHFANAKNFTYNIPNDIKELTGPKVIFVGAISSYKIDFDLLATIANKHKDWNLLMIGQVGEGQPDTNISVIEVCSNIHLLGSKDYAEIPKYMHFSDVAIIPSNINDYTKSMFPMKFFEYLSAGLQVVCTNLPSLQEYKNLCFISNDINEFENNLINVLDYKITKSSKKIESECKKHTWDNRYKKMMKTMGFIQ